MPSQGNEQAALFNTTAETNNILNSAHQELVEEAEDPGICYAGVRDDCEPEQAKTPEKDSIKLSDLVNFSLPSTESVMEGSKHSQSLTDSGMFLSHTGTGTEDVLALEDEDMDSSNHQADEEVLSGITGEVVLRRSTRRGRRVERPISYQMATDEAEQFNLLIKEQLSKTATGGRDKDRKKARKTSEGSNKRDPVKRCTSTVTQSSQAVITLRRSLGHNKSPRAQSSTSGYSLPTSFAVTDALSDSFATGEWKKLSWTKLNQLIEMEIGTGTYPAPLIGCIPPSALKFFRDKSIELETTPPSNQNHPGIV